MRRNIAGHFLMRVLITTLILLVASATSLASGRTRAVRRDALVPLYSVFEQSLSWPSATYTNPWEQVTVTMTVRSPSGREVRVGGFYHSAGTWKARLAPSEIGEWTWELVLTDGAASTGRSGRFTVVPSDARGFVRPNPESRFRWIFEDGSPYHPIGIGDCIMDNDKDGDPLNEWGLDGEFRAGHDDGRTVDIDTYLSAYRQTGVNLFRWSVDNCAFDLYQTIDSGGNVYLVEQGQTGDELVKKLRQYGFRVYMVLFGFDPPGVGHTSSLSVEQMAAVKRYVKYIVDRYGAYVDFWELMNEAAVTEAWYREVASYLREIDPYKHPISTSWERPDLEVIEINSPHWYQKESELDSDRETWLRFEHWKSSGKPVVAGEQGNTGQNWDKRSALRMRLRSWTAFFAEGVLIFWNSSFAKDYRNEGAASIYLGPEERQYLRALQDFTRGFDRRAAIAHVSVSDPARVRAYALTSPTTYAVYLHAYTDHSNPTSGIAVTIDPEASGTATWIEPATGRVLETRPVPFGPQMLTAPPFLVDVALKITSL